jgi:hypothetical protein
MKELHKLGSDFSLSLLEERGHWALRIHYVILLPERKQHERYLMSHRNKIRHWKILDNAIAFIQAEKRLSAYNSLKIRFESGLTLTTEGNKQ